MIFCEYNTIQLPISTSRGNLYVPGCSVEGLRVVLTTAMNPPLFDVVSFHEIGGPLPTKGNGEIRGENEVLSKEKEIAVETQFCAF